MLIKKVRFARRIALAAMVVGVATQAGACSPIALAFSLGTQGAANLLSDTIFFFLDNLFVRMGG
jgi:hypothetical protein